LDKIVNFILANEKSLFPFSFGFGSESLGRTLKTLKQQQLQQLNKFL